MSLSVDTFERELNVRCALGESRYRVRWSTRREVWMIEQKVGRAHELPRKGDPDVWSRIKDGYSLVANVSPTPWFKCRKCAGHLRAPELKFGEVKCPCTAREREQANEVYYCAYFPLCERLLLWLEQTSPKRGNAWVAEMNAINKAKVDAQDRDWNNHLESGLLDYHNVIAGIPRTSNLTNSYN